MKKVRMPSIKIGKINIKEILNYLLIIFLTSFILISILISLPLTETISSNITYDLRTKDSMYWAKEYVLDLGNADAWSIDDVKSVLYRRLNKLGVEKISMSSYSQDNKQYVHISVQSSISQTYVDEMIRSPFRVNIVTRNPEIDFDDPENPYAVYLAENYVETEFKREDFRNIYVTNLKNSSNEYSYFALFKTWPWNTSWSDFLAENGGIEVGVAIDGFVTPVTVPTTPPIMFAVPLSTTGKEESELVSILYNSGVIPVSYTLVDQQEVPVESIEADYIKLTMGMMIAVIAIYSYLFFIERTNKKTIFTCGLATVITISTYIAYLKIVSIPVDIFLLCVELLVMIALLRMIVENIESRVIINILLVFAVVLTILLGTGYAKIFASDILLLLVIGYISGMIAKLYIHKVERLLK
jgi:hypothetical protein